jgi:hypothetical protein
VEGGKNGVNSYAKRVAFVVAHCSMGILSDSVSSVVAPAYLRCGIFPIGMATASAKGKFEVAHYRGGGFHVSVASPLYN